MLEHITITLVYAYFIVLCRAGACIMLLPGIGEMYISSRSRLILTLTISLVIVPVASPSLPAMPESSLALAIIILSEVTIGFFIGSVARILLSAMHTAGAVISMQIGLASANLFDPSQGGQSSTIGIFMTFMAVLLIFITNTHHIFIYGIVDSYNLFPPKAALPLGGFSDVISSTVADSFSIAIKIAAPQIIIGLMIYLSAGVMGRLMPQMQVFFIIMPVNIGVGFLVMMATLSATMMLYMAFFTENVTNFMM